jgi:hypothetical protein
MNTQTTKDWDAEWSQHFNSINEEANATKPVISIERKEYTYRGEHTVYYYVKFAWPHFASACGFKTLEEAEQFVKDKTQ